MPIMGAVKLFECRSADLPDDAADGDCLNIGTTEHNVRAIRPDGEGMTVLIVETKST